MTLDEAQQLYATPASRFATIAGVRLHWIDEGPARPPLTIVLLPSQWVGARQAERWAAALRDTYRVIRLDLPGQGLAGPFADGDYTMPRHAALLATWLAQVVTGRYLLVGTSLSGTIAVLHAATQPAALAGLVLANASGLPRPGGAAVFPPAGGAPRDEAFFRARLAGLLKSPHALTDALVAETAALDRLPGRCDEANARGRAFTSDATLPALAEIDVPVLLQWSTDSTYLPATMANRFAAALTRTASTIHVHPGVGHLIIIDAPQATAAQARQFAQGIA
jgi:pimeloyl-ACP methyl ester carboxylesterase